MNGLSLLTHVRKVLRDVQSDYVKGEFWHDVEVVLALNAAQDAFVNYCLDNRHYHLLDSLLTNTGYVLGTTLPTDYLYYSSAKAGSTAGTQVIARVYDGGEAYQYRWVSHTAALITQDSYTFIYNGVTSSGTLYYYRRPSYIGLASLGDNTRTDFGDIDFDDYVYNNFIASHAAVLLAIKEIQNQRDIKTLVKYFKEATTQPKEVAEYPINNEVSEILLRKMIQYAESNR
jgi:hypothetical protein